MVRNSNADQVVTGRARVSLCNARADRPGYANRTHRRHRPALVLVTQAATADALAERRLQLAFERCEQAVREATGAPRMSEAA